MWVLQRGYEPSREFELTPIRILHRLLMLLPRPVFLLWLSSSAVPNREGRCSFPLSSPLVTSMLLDRMKWAMSPATVWGNEGCACVCLCVCVCVWVCVCVCVCVCVWVQCEWIRAEGKHRLVSSRPRSFTELLQNGSDPGHKEEETGITTLTLFSGFHVFSRVSPSGSLGSEDRSGDQVFFYLKDSESLWMLMFESQTSSLKSHV